MLREIELASVVKKDVEFKGELGCDVATLCVSASKLDWKAKGVTRHHGCACPSVWCPVKASKILVGAADKKSREAPSAVTSKGEVPTKVSACNEIKRWAVHSGASEGVFTGHSLRTTGAQRLAMAGSAKPRFDSPGVGHCRQCWHT